MKVENYTCKIHFFLILIKTSIPKSINSIKGNQIRQYELLFYQKKNYYCDTNLSLYKL